MARASKTYDEKEECFRNRKGRDHLGDLCLSRRTILKWILKICRMDSKAL
jgi:hypothetical protein